MSNVKNKTIIILHGWGLEGSKYRNLAALFKEKNFNVLNPDLPGFGSRPLVSSNMNLDDYVEFLNGFIRKNKIRKPILLGHSFGGRIAIKYAWLYPKKVDKLILTGVPIIRNRSLLKKIYFVLAIFFGIIFKFFPSFLKQKIRKAFYFAVDEWDYYNAGPLKQVFKNITEEDLGKYTKETNVPIFLVWGKDDKITPICDLSKIKKLNSSAKTVVVDGIGHKLPYENPKEFYKSLSNFI